MFSHCLVGAIFGPLYWRASYYDMRPGAPHHGTSTMRHMCPPLHYIADPRGVMRRTMDVTQKDDLINHYTGHL